MPYSTFFSGIPPCQNEKQSVYITRQKLEIVRNDVENAASLFSGYLCIYVFIYLLKLEREKAQHAAEMVELENKIAELKDQLHKARHGLQDEVDFLKSLSARKSCHNSWMTVTTSINFIFNIFPGLRKMCSFKGGNSLLYFRGLVKGAMSRWYCCFRWMFCRARWPLAPNFCPRATRKSQIFHSNHMLGTLDFTVSEHWASFNFP